MIIGEKVTFARSGVFLCGEDGWKRTENPNNTMFVASLQKSFRVLFEAYIWPDGSGPLYFSDWLSLLQQDSILLSYFLERNSSRELLPIIRDGWMQEYRSLAESGDGGVKGRDFFTLRKAFIVSERARILCDQAASSEKLHSCLHEASEHFELLARRLASHGDIAKDAVISSIKRD